VNTSEPTIGDQVSTVIVLGPVAASSRALETCGPAGRRR
jgi:hypothetical protein